MEIVMIMLLMLSTLIVIIAIINLVYLIFNKGDEKNRDLISVISIAICILYITIFMVRNNILLKIAKEDTIVLPIKNSKEEVIDYELINNKEE